MYDFFCKTMSWRVARLRLFVLWQSYCFCRDKCSYAGLGWKKPHYLSWNERSLLQKSLLWRSQWSSILGKTEMCPVLRFSEPTDLGRHIISVKETKSLCNGFYRHNAPKISLYGTKSSAPVLAFHVATGCYTLNLWLTFFCGQSLCCVQSNQSHVDDSFNSCTA